MFILIETSPGLGILARWGPLPISMVLRSVESLKSEILSLAPTSKYVKNTGVLSIVEPLYAKGALCGPVDMHRAPIGSLCEGSSMRLYKASTSQRRTANTERTHQT